MEKGKLIKLAIAFFILIAAYFAFSDLAKTENAQEIVPKVPASSDKSDLMNNGEKTEEGLQEKENLDDGAGASVPVQQSTPEERASRTVSPSDAASYSEDDLPPDF
jgi:hypothetical protein